MTSAMAGEFLDECESWGWDLLWLRTEPWGLLWRKAIYEFHLHPEHPLTWRDARGYWQPDRHEAETDLGSIPPPLRGIIPHDQFPRSYCFHDSAWRHGGLWYSPTQAGPYRFERLSRAESNRMLYYWARAEGGHVRPYLIYAGVTIGLLTRCFMPTVASYPPAPAS